MDLTLSLRDWIQLATMIAIGGAGWYRLGKVEEGLNKIKDEYVRKDVFNLVVQLLRAQMGLPEHDIVKET